MDQTTVTNQIAAAHDLIDKLRAEVGRVVVGQQAIVDRLVIALLIRGHVLVEQQFIFVKLFWHGAFVLSLR